MRTQLSITKGSGIVDGLTNLGTLIFSCKCDYTNIVELGGSSLNFLASFSRVSVEEAFLFLLGGSVAPPTMLKQ